MAENAPPPGTAPNGQAEGPRGVPYYEKLRRDLREALQKKRVLDDTLSRLDNEIMLCETRYLEETTAGNIIKGFDNYIKGAAGTGGGAASGGTSTRRRTGITEQDRIFSRSSASVSRPQDSPAPSSSTTPSHAPTPNSAHPHSSNATPGSTGPTKSGGTKKKKAAAAATADADDEGEARAVKRTKISYGRD